LSWVDPHMMAGLAYNELRHRENRAEALVYISSCSTS
jgi:hypothetical protein